MIKDDLPSHIIKKLTLFHCKRGPRRCYLCQEQRAEKICLIKICPSDGVTRKMIQVKIGNKSLLCEVEIIHIFNSSLEAEIFAHEKNIQLDI